MNKQPCYCPAYSFPHRVGGGDCKELFPMQSAKEELGWSVREHEETENFLMNRDNARAINRENRRQL